ncbi:hypothetical protein IMG5_152170 [Ichthyophthirius multifiliis]|uniref:3-oxoacyl-[acyl-carrier-protein] reductase n=1 Tax=Ichthyophthirius multifiliis TaxID=5932 RepID=G0QYU1_ICHMU|nr:hypothetical protein IMG5_152170 [Ichthyophthirius multifiliis]EGR29616.1 hypothetical protein IMG5_152170 [Ichthyophthirius multifiliis]|eukprot:XP_004030852.1 hypothetical protein IMG5_152170 [Ichthyophthirius multifiliis]
MKQKIALITGSSSGIGLKIAQIFQKEKIKVLMCGLDDFNQKFKVNENLIDYTKIDLQDKQQRQNYVQKIILNFKGIDILINNAGIFRNLQVEDTSLEDWQQMLELNLTVPFFLIQSFIPYMKQQKFGRIINISSQKGIKGAPKQSAYSATKHGLIGLTKSVALETCQYGITCNSICPAWVKTTPLIQEIQQTAEKIKLVFKKNFKAFQKINRKIMK